MRSRSYLPVDWTTCALPICEDGKPLHLLFRADSHAVFEYIDIQVFYAGFRGTCDPCFSYD